MKTNFKRAAFIAVLPLLIGIKGVLHNVNIPYKITSNEATLAYLKERNEIRTLTARENAVYKLLSKYNSPLKDEYKTFVSVAKDNDLDWTLLVAISGVESTFGKNVSSYTYNPFGWGQGRVFKDWKDSIEAVGAGVGNYRTKYGAQEIEEIALIYCPPTSRSWAFGVNYFKKELEDLEKEQDSLGTLPVKGESLSH